MTFSDYFGQVATRFLQNVVIVDDEAFLGAAEIEAAVHSELETIEKARSAKATEPQVVEPGAVAEPGAALSVTQDDAAPGEDLDVKEVIDEFGRLGIFCSAIVPTARGELEPGLTLAQQADIIVLDWLIHRDDETAKDFIRNVIRKDRHRVRLIVIYTGHADLADLKGAMDEVEATLGEIPRSCTRSDDFTVVGEALKIVIYGKRHSVGKVAGYEDRLRSWRELPNQAVRDFVDLCKGLVPAVVLGALSDIRERSWQLLSAFGQELDPAYLWHRASIPTPSDAESQLLEMVVGEIEAILFDSECAERAGIAAITLWIMDQTVDWKERFAIPGETYGGTQVVSLLTEGAAQQDPGSVALVQDSALRLPGPRRKAGSLFFLHEAAFAPSAQEMARVNALYASRSLLKTVLGSPTPTLHLGSIVAKTTDDGTQYWLCLLPLCDSERIGTSRKYPMIPLARDENRFDFVVFDGDDELHLQLDLSPFSVEMIEFAPSPGDQAVIANQRDSSFFFSSISGDDYRWIAELKSAHASRVAHQFATKISRVGLDESEWLRRKAKRKR